MQEADPNIFPEMKLVEPLESIKKCGAAILHFFTQRHSEGGAIAFIDHIECPDEVSQW